MRAVRATVTLVGCESYGYKGRVFRKNFPQVVDGDLLQHIYECGEQFIVQPVSRPASATPQLTVNKVAPPPAPVDAVPEPGDEADQTSTADDCDGEVLEEDTDADAFDVEL